MNVKRTTSWPRRNRPAGFTLPEVVVGMLIIAAVVVAVYAAISTGFNSMRLARENLRASQVMLEKMEIIRLYNWDQITTNSVVPATFKVPYDVNKTYTNGYNGLVYEGTLAIESVPLNVSYSNELRLVTVKLNWNSGGLQRQREFSTYVCRSGIQNYLY